ncbi:MAG: hypothetical protein AAF908_07910, partial [Pseudomonadota bacterium]
MAEGERSGLGGLPASGVATDGMAGGGSVADGSVGGGSAGGGAVEVPFRGGAFTPVRRRGVGLLVFVVLIAVWEAGTQAGWISALTLPRPSDVVATLWQLWASGQLVLHMGPSLSRLAVGAAMGASAGIGVGISIGLFSLVRAGLVPLVAAIFPIPKIALLPLFVIWFGIDEGSKYALIAFGT